MAHNGQTISLGNILWKVLKNPLAADLTYEEAAEYALEFIGLIGSPLAYEDKITNPPLEIINHKAELPCDLLEIRGVRYSDCKFDNYNNGIALRYASDIFHLNNDIDIENYQLNGKKYTHEEATYIVQKGIIFTTIQSGYVQISYKAVMVDEDNYPLIPDNAKTILALEYFILHRYLEPLWMMGKITDKSWQYICQQRDWYIGSADASLRGVTPDQLATAMQGINRIIVSTTAHSNFFKRYGEKEFLKRQK